MTNTKKLKRRIVEAGMSVNSVAEMIGISRASLSRRINNKGYFTVNEINELCEVLDINNKDTYFFWTNDSHFGF